MADPLQPLYARLMILNNRIKDSFPSVPELYEILASMGSILQRKVTMAPTDTPDGAAKKFAAGGFALDINGTKLACTEVNIIDGQNNAWTAAGCAIHTDVSLDPSFGKKVCAIAGHIGGAISAAIVVRPYFQGGATNFGYASSSSGYAKKLTITLAVAIPQGQALQVALVVNGVTTNLKLSIPPGALAGVYQNVTDYVRINQGDIVSMSFNVVQAVNVTPAGWEFIFAGDNNEIYSGGDHNAVSIAATTTLFQGLLNNVSSTTESQNVIPWPINSTFQNMFVRTNGNQPGTGNFVVTLRNGAFPTPLSDTALVVTIPLSAVAGEYADTTDQVSVSAGTLVGFKCVNNATAGSAILGSIHVDTAAGGTTQGPIPYGAALGNFSLGAGATFYLAPNGFTFSTQPPADHAVAVAGTLQTLYVYTSTTQANDAPLTIEVIKNGVATGLIITIAANAVAAVTSLALNLAMNAKDKFCLKVSYAGALTSAVFPGWSVGFLPS